MLLIREEARVILLVKYRKREFRVPVSYITITRKVMSFITIICYGYLNTLPLTVIIYPLFYIISHVFFSKSIIDLNNKYYYTVNSR